MTYTDHPVKELTNTLVLNYDMPEAFAKGLAEFLYDEGYRKSREEPEEKVESHPFIPETLTQCRQHYVPPVKEHIHCPYFGHTDGTNGSCWWCLEMTPYQWHMCQDESWVRSLLSPINRFKCKSTSEAIQFIEKYKQEQPMGNERRGLRSEFDE
jgi:hypothetical protein